MEDERRQHQRKDSLFNINYKVISPPNGHGNTTGIDISEGGIALPIDHLLCPGIILELGITLGDSSDLIVTTGEVVWVKEQGDEKFPYVVGIKFINISRRDNDRVYYHIHRRNERADSPGVGWIE